MMTDQQQNLELYKTFVDTITATEQRRQQASGIYLSLLSAGAATLGIAKDLDPIYIVIPALTISLIWLTSLFYFRGLAEAKFKVINKLEADWPVKPFEFEWQAFKAIRQKKPLLKISLTYLEMVPPALIFLGGLIYLIVRLYQNFCSCL